jgi:hypothetical protein
LYSVDPSSGTVAPTDAWARRLAASDTKLDSTSVLSGRLIDTIAPTMAVNAGGGIETTRCRNQLNQPIQSPSTPSTTTPFDVALSSADANSRWTMLNWTREVVDTLIATYELARATQTSTESK